MHTMQVWLHAAKKIGAVTIGTPRQVSFVAKSSSGEIVGGLLAKLQMKVLYIESAWVNPEYQRSGVGVSLREQVFAFAKRMTASISSPRAMSFTMLSTISPKLTLRSKSSVRSTTVRVPIRWSS
ncbi:MAG: GNAT family N-acetyltransferase [Bdellovibrionales bacterium]|nr:GNAT family N-acetyltransferase [Bdellovibrionales bacterium]